MKASYSRRPIRAIRCFALATLLLHITAAQNAFEVASIKAADPTRSPIVDFRVYPGGRVVVTNYTLKMLTEIAYGVSSYRITGGPAWVDTELFDITAKPAAGSAAAGFMPPTGKPFVRPSVEFREMMQTLLVDRFGLKLQRETRQLPVLTLTVGKRKPKLEPAPDPSGDPVWGSGQDEKEWRSVSIPILISIIEAQYRRAVIDRTGLSGSYDFRLTYDARNHEIHEDDDVSISPKWMSLQMALDIQLGLKLEEIIGVVETFVIDKATKPAEN